MRDVPALTDTPGFVVDWQLTDDAATVVDVCADRVDTEVVLTDPPVIVTGVARIS
jgi:hypothetical protein